jgi:hypothetical protein
MDMAAWERVKHTRLTSTKVAEPQVISACPGTHGSGVGRHPWGEAVHSRWSLRHGPATVAACYKIKLHRVPAHD